MYLDEWVSINSTSKVYYRRKEMRQRTCCGCHIYQDLWKKKKYLLGGDSVEHL